MEQIDGTLLAPARGGSWQKSSLWQWINFKWIHNFTIQGTGIVDGHGYDWWTTSDFDLINLQVINFVIKINYLEIIYYRVKLKKNLKCSSQLSSNIKKLIKINY